MIEQTTQNHENRPKGYEIEPVHNPVPRKIDWTQTEGCGLSAAARPASAV